MPMWVRHSGTWRKIETGGLHVRHSGTWRKVEKGYVKHSGTWRQFYIISDPVTVTLAPDYTRTYMYNGGRAWCSIVGVSDDAVMQGYWESSQGTVPGPSGTWSHVSGMMGFNDLAAQLAVRPVIKSAVLRMGLWVAYGGAPQSSRLVLGAYTTGASAPATIAHTDAAKGLQETVNTIWTAEGQVKEVAFNAAMLAQLQTSDRYGIALHDTTHGSSETRKRETRTVWYGASAASSLAPRLTVTLDYI